MRVILGLLGVFARFSLRNDFDDADMKALEAKRPKVDDATTMDDQGIKQMDDGKKKLEELEARTKTWAEQKENEYALQKKKIAEVTTDNGENTVTEAIKKLQEKRVTNKKKDETKDEDRGDAETDADAETKDVDEADAGDADASSFVQTDSKYPLAGWNFDAHDTHHTEDEIKENERALSQDMKEEHSNIEGMIKRMKDQGEKFHDKIKIPLSSLAQIVTDQDVQDERDKVMAEEKKNDSLLDSLKKSLMHSSFAQVSDPLAFSHIMNAKPEDSTATLQRMAKKLHEEAHEIGEKEHAPPTNLKALREADAEIETGVDKAEEEITSLGNNVATSPHAAIGSFH